MNSFRYGGEPLTNRPQFEAQLRDDGYTEIEAKSLQPRPANDHHGHPFAVRVLVLAGAFTVLQNNNSKTYRTGEIFLVAADHEHPRKSARKSPKSASGASTRDARVQKAKADVQAPLLVGTRQWHVPVRDVEDRLE